MTTRRLTLAMLAVGLGVLVAVGQQEPAVRGTPWTRHTIDDSTRGSDGVKPMDVNGDGRLDLVTGWEEGGVIRAYLNPGPDKVKERWPAVTVGKVKKPEDAVFVDLDGDGAVDVVSCCESGTKQVYVHWAPKEKPRYLDAAAWKTETIPAVEGQAMWMFCLPMQIDGKNGIDLVVGGKGPGAKIGWLEAPADPRDLKAWKWHPLCDVGWVMSLVAADLDGDGDLDVLASDRKGKNAGVLWLEHPGADKAGGEWKVHHVGPQKEEVMFLDLGDLDGDGLADVLVPTFNRKIYWHRRKPGKAVEWETTTIPFPDRPGTGKAVRVGDVDGDGKPDFVLTLGEGQPDRGGVVWMKKGKDGWEANEVNGPPTAKGFKPDLIQMIDVDGDGDPDVLTTEERAGYGVVWYENPAKKK